MVVKKRDGVRRSAANVKPLDKVVEATMTTRRKLPGAEVGAALIAKPLPRKGCAIARGFSFPCVNTGASKPLMVNCPTPGHPIGCNIFVQESHYEVLALPWPISLE